MAGGPFHFVISWRDETIDGQTVSAPRSRFEISQRRQMDRSIGENAQHVGTERHGGGNRAGRLEMSLGVDGTYR